MSVVIRSLLQDHANVNLLLSWMERQFAGFACGGTVDWELMRATLDYFASFPDACHHPKEDLILQRLRQRVPGQVEDLARLEEEHAELAAATAALQLMVERIAGEEEIPRDTLTGSARSYVDNYRRHMAMEEQTLFQRAAELLQPEDWLEIGEAIYQRMDPVFGSRHSAAFDRLRTDVAAAD